MDADENLPRRKDDLVAQLRAGSLALAHPTLLRYGVGAEEARRFGLPCGGTLELMLEPLGPQSAVDELLARLTRGERVRRVLELATGTVTLAPAEPGADTLVLSDTQLVSHHGPQWRLLVIGAGQMTDYLAQMALALGYGVTVCDPRAEYADGFALAGVTRRARSNNEEIGDMAVDDQRLGALEIAGFMDGRDIADAGERLAQRATKQRMIVGDDERIA